MNFRHKLPSVPPSIWRVVSHRGSTRALKIVLLFFVLVNILYFLFFRLRGSLIVPLDLDIIDDSTTNQESDINQPQQPVKNEVGVTETKYSSQFNKILKKKLASVEKDKKRFWLAHTGLTETSFKLPAKQFMSGQSNPSSFIYKNELFYDPRFTLSVYFHELKLRYLSQNSGGEKSEKLHANNAQAIQLPFHWSDWMDLTLLNSDLAKPISERIDCEYIQAHTNNKPNPSYFCLDNAKLTDEDVHKFGFNNREQLPGFIIHAHSTHEDRTFNDFRVMESKSYALTNLLKPYKVVILSDNEHGGTFEFEVNPDVHERMVTSDMMMNYLRAKNINPESVRDDTTIVVDHLREYKELLKVVYPKVLTDEEDIHGMYRTSKKQMDPKASRELELPARLFAYSPSVVEEQIRFFEEESEIKISELSRNDRSYYEGLKECSKYDDKNEPTYFKMATIHIDDTRNRDREWGWHYDWRFFNGALNYERVGWTEQEQRIRTNIILDRLLRNWNRFAEEKGIVTWIMHGPLLSWYWDGLMFPFDVDIDIQMPILELARLAKEYNQTLVVEDPTEGYGKYLIDVGTYIHNRGISEKSNHIDARFVDVDSGIYVDLTAVSKSKANPPSEYDDNKLANIKKEPDDDQVEIYNDRRKHFYTLDQLSPLKYSMLGGVPVYIPATITDRLVFEYSRGLTRYEFGGWFFVPRLNLWLRTEQVAQAFSHLDIVNKEGNIDRNLLVKKLGQMTDRECMKLLDNDEILVEYYLTRELTDLHAQEKQYLFDTLGRDNAALNDNRELKERYNELTSTFKMRKPLRKPLWDFENLEHPKHHQESA